MISTTVSTKKLDGIGAQASILFLEQNQSLAEQYKEYAFLFPQFELLTEQRKFIGAALDVMMLPFIINSKASYFIFVGLGERNKNASFDVELYRRAVAKGVRTAISVHASSVALQLPKEQMIHGSVDYIAEQTVISSFMSTYHYDEYITQEDRKETKITELILCTQEAHVKLVEKGIDQGTVIAQAVNKARHWIDAPPLHLTPAYLADQAEAIAKKHNLIFKRFDENQVINLGMGGLASVSKGSDLDCQFLVMEYKTDEDNAQTLAFVGKGITFDSGGLSLKPAQSMETMKDDMSGAAAVIAAMEVLAQLKPKVNVIGFVPLSENLPSGKATKPGDVIRFYNGKTAEVKNTDAEGRLILADALSYAIKHYKPDAIIDIATLTGACAYALGPFYTGLMSQHDVLVEKITHAAQISGDFVWRLPMSDDYKKAIKSDVADICNIGDGRIKAGAITAAHFLQHFVENTPWAHLDIAGTAFDVPNIPYYRSGATGVGVRLLTILAMNW